MLADDNASGSWVMLSTHRRGMLTITDRSGNKDYFQVLWQQEQELEHFQVQFPKKKYEKEQETKKAQR